MNLKRQTLSYKYLLELKKFMKITFYIILAIIIKRHSFTLPFFVCVSFSEPTLYNGCCCCQRYALFCVYFVWCVNLSFYMYIYIPHVWYYTYRRPAIWLWSLCNMTLKPMYVDNNFTNFTTADDVAIQSTRSKTENAQRMVIGVGLWTWNKPGQI